MTNTKSLSVLISGASIAGPALASWLHAYGHRVTVVERAPQLRQGGQAVDFRGDAHLTMLRKMGILTSIQARQTSPGPLNLIDAAGRTQVSLPADFTGGDVEILRGDLAELLYERTRHGAEYVFGDSITSLTETASGVDVTFERGAPRTFDLVVGADGLHSNVRRLAFGPEKEFVKDTGYHVAIFSAPDHLGLGHAGLLYNEPGRGISVGSHGPGTASVLCVFAGGDLTFDRRDTEQQKGLVARAFAGMGWEATRFVEAMWQAEDFYFDAISLVQMPRYTNGRIALLGDAGYGATCGGMGAGMAMISSYVLAGELASAAGDHRVAFAEYERQLKDYAKACQRVASGAGSFLAPKTARGIGLRNSAHKILTLPMFGNLLKNLTTKAANSITLKEYPVPVRG
ncbi:FAD-dependent monooxygenase [Longispora albida]|uniref:FAD-dependent monooxygenase n=1 Tax=Longispora albida TaxID=203523 RepID=UPI000364EDB1|nr:FAD-dependent monooxygenase [Longispora albida]